MKGPLSFLIAASAVAGIAYANVVPPPPGEEPAGLALNAVCAGDKLFVTIDVTPQTGNVINAGQYFLNFNTLILDFQSATEGEDPFDFIIMPPDVDEAAGTIDGFATGSFFGPGSDQPKTMAVLIFDIDPAQVKECQVLDNLVTWQDPPPGEPRTMLTLDGGVLFEPDPLTDLGPVTYDTMAPAVGTVIITPGNPCELVVNFEADVIEACCLGPVKINVLFPDNPGQPCATVLNVSFQLVPISGGVKAVGFVVFSNLTECPCNIEIEVIAEDCCGKTGMNSSTFAVEDLSAPVVTVTSPPLDSNDDFETPADAGGCSAVVTLSATATDNCDGPFDPADIEFVIDLDCDGFGAGDPVCAAGNPCDYDFPQGTTCVRARATDNCDNEGYYDFTVTVLPYNEMVLDISLQSVFELSIIRCIHFELFGCAGGVAGDHTVDRDLTFTSIGPGEGNDGSFSGTVLIPCGDWVCITAEDKLHTLRRSIDGSNFMIVGTQYIATFPDLLLGGNYDEHINYPNPFIDIGDFSVWAAEFQAQACYDSSCPGNPDGCTPCGEITPPHADGNGDGCVVNTADFTFIQTNWLERHEECCDVGAPSIIGPITHLSETNEPSSAFSRRGNRSIRQANVGAPGFGLGTPGSRTTGQSAFSRRDDLPILQLNVADLTAQGYGHLAAADLNGDGWIDVVDMLMVMMDQMAGLGLN